MLVWPSKIFEEDVLTLLGSKDEEDVKAGRLVTSIVKAIVENIYLNWHQLKDADELEIADGVYISLCSMAEYNIEYSCGIYRIKILDEDKKTSRDFKFRIAVGQSPKAKKRLGLLSVFPKINKKGSAEDAYIPQTENGQRILDACKELSIYFKPPK
jgi:hypothetical protein